MKFLILSLACLALASCSTEQEKDTEAKRLANLPAPLAVALAVKEPLMIVAFGIMLFLSSSSFHRK